MDVHLGTPDDVIASLRADSALARATDLAVQVHSIDPPHPFILRSIELVAEVVAPALGWGRTARRPRGMSRDHRTAEDDEDARTDTDVIDALVGITPGSPLDAIRARRPEARDSRAGDLPRAVRAGVPGGVTAAERFAVGGSSPACMATRRSRRSTPSASPRAGPRRRQEAVDAAIAAARPRPLWPLPRRAAEPRRHRRPELSRGARNPSDLGPRLAAAFEHAHLLVFHPRDAAPAALQALLDAGWSTTDIVTLSQIVAFLSFQIRVVAGLRVLAGAA